MTITQSLSGSFAPTYQHYDLVLHGVEGEAKIMIDGHAGRLDEVPADFSRLEISW